MAADQFVFREREVESGATAEFIPRFTDVFMRGFYLGTRSTTSKYLLSYSINNSIPL